MAGGRLTSRQIVEQYLTRLGLYEDRLHAAIAINPKALERSRRARSRARAGKTARSAARHPGRAEGQHPHDRHADHRRRAGVRRLRAAVRSDAHEEPARRRRDHHRQDRLDRAGQLGGRRADADAGQLQRGRRLRLQPVRSAAAIRATASFDGRPALQTGGSSSGIGTAANLLGGQRRHRHRRIDPQPVEPNMLVGIKPTIGRISRYGVIPITADHDTAGPMARRVTDAAIMLGALESASPDPNDPATQTCTPPPGRDYTKFLNADGLKGARIGIPRAFYYDRITLTGDRRAPDGIGRRPASPPARRPQRRAGEGDGRRDRRAEAAGRRRRRSRRHPELRRQGSEAATSLRWDFCSGADQAKGKDDGCSVNFKYGMKRDFNAWLKSLGPSAPVKTLTELRAVEHGAREGRRDQVRAVAPRHLGRNGSRCGPRAQRRRHAERHLLSRANGIDGVLKAHSPRRDLHTWRHGRRPCRPRRLPDHRSCPSAWSRTRRTPPFPAGFEAQPAPFGVGFTGRGVQRAAADRARLRIRAGDQKKRAAGRFQIDGERVTAWTCSAHAQLCGSSSTS